ncbi:Calcium-binding mitochondrial carrier protein SCaMC-1-B [Grifola frondosa]|uniref:Calcium-binding mitochondrial carrier protein SCaMC-1-B n=1 Tax=Grifola frondosa TaxID=5627 RepID=A0A1C7M0D5_GRIFR|nr:Calcium-binding mitochondrial carrier protein SCaMC-1-B [Grifola frondosa]
MYEDELLGRCGGRTRGFFNRDVTWSEFLRYAEAKEAELWHIFHDELDLDSNGHLDAAELSVALDKAGIKLSSSTLSEFMRFLTLSPHSHVISFPEFRDFLLLMPRRASPAEIYRYYEVQKFMGDDGRGPARVNMEGDVSLSAEDLCPVHPHHPKEVPLTPTEHKPSALEDEEYDEEYDVEYYDGEFEEEEVHQYWIGGHTAMKFLLAGGMAGAAIGGAIARIYSEGGVLAFWTGNGLSVAKILPESAIKFLAYESSKRMFAQYWDKVDDVRDISGVSRFLSGGMGGISSQLTIYPIETLKASRQTHRPCVC